MSGMIRRAVSVGRRRVIVEEPIPPISRFQAHEMLRARGLFDTARAAAEAAGPAVLRAFDGSNEWHRDSQHVNALGSAMGLTAAELDELFLAAAAIRF